MASTSSKCAAFLRGINVGGKNLIKMEDLRGMFVQLGFHDARTFIQSGNVLFTTSTIDPDRIAKTIEKGLQKILGYPVSIFVRDLKQLERMVKREPFAKVEPSNDLKLYVTFIDGNSRRNQNSPCFLL